MKQILFTLLCCSALISCDLLEDIRDDVQDEIKDLTEKEDEPQDTYDILSIYPAGATFSFFDTIYNASNVDIAQYFATENITLIYIEHSTSSYITIAYPGKGNLFEEYNSEYGGIQVELTVNNIEYKIHDFTFFIRYLEHNTIVANFYGYYYYTGEEDAPLFQEVSGSVNTQITSAL